jgi:peptidyl-tRNA hydrolase
MDIESKLKTKSYNRLRIGISGGYENFNQIEFVLGKLSENEHKELLSIFPKICKAITSFVMDGVDSAMNNYN